MATHTTNNECSPCSSEHRYLIVLSSSRPKRSISSPASRDRLSGPRISTPRSIDYSAHLYAPSTTISPTVRVEEAKGGHRDDFGDNWLTFGYPSHDVSAENHRGLVPRWHEDLVQTPAFITVSVEVTTQSWAMTYDIGGVDQLTLRDNTAE